MSTFRVQPDTLKSQALVYQNVASEMADYSAQTKAIADELDFSLIMMKPAVEMLALRMNGHSIKADKTAQSLVQIAMEYTKAEQNVIGNIKMPGKYTTNPSNPSNPGRENPNGERDKPVNEEDPTNPSKGDPENGGGKNEDPLAAEEEVEEEKNNGGSGTGSGGNGSGSGGNGSGNGANQQNSGAAAGGAAAGGAAAGGAAAGGAGNGASGNNSATAEKQEATGQEENKEGKDNGNAGGAGGTGGESTQTGESSGVVARMGTMRNVFLNDNYVTSGDRAAADKIYQALIDEGYSPEAAAAILGNLEAEHGFLTSWTGDQGSVGLAQWRGDRKNALLEFAKSLGKDPTDLDVQIQFLVKKDMYNRLGADGVEKLKGMTDFVDATDYVCHKYESPARYATKAAYEASKYGQPGKNHINWDRFVWSDETQNFELDLQKRRDAANFWYKEHMFGDKLL